MTESWIPAQFLLAIKWLLATAVLYFVISRVIRPLAPPFVALELASTPTHAKRVRMAWQDAGQIWRAYTAILLETLLIPFYFFATLHVARAFMNEDHQVVLNMNVIVVIAMLVAAVMHLAENIGLVVTLMIGARAPVVWLTRILGRIKYTIIALTVVWVIFQIVFSIYMWLGKPHRVNTLAWLIAATVVVGLLVMRRLTMLSRNYPPLFALQFAPSRLAAKDVLERWGQRGRKSAERALLLESLLAVLYGLTLATICQRHRVDQQLLNRTAEYLGWVMLAAASCHIAQNVGAYVALRREAMGWWVGTMQRLGRLRLFLLGVVATYFVSLLIRAEWIVIREVGTAIKQLTQGPLPW